VSQRIAEAGIFLQVALVSSVLLTHETGVEG